MLRHRHLYTAVTSIVGRVARTCVVRKGWKTGGAKHFQEKAFDLIRRIDFRKEAWRTWMPVIKLDECCNVADHGTEDLPFIGAK